jgi:hypothetical protein
MRPQSCYIRIFCHVRLRVNECVDNVIEKFGATHIIVVRIILWMLQYWRTPHVSHGAELMEVATGAPRPVSIVAIRLAIEMPAILYENREKCSWVVSGD